MREKEELPKSEGATVIPNLATPATTPPKGAIARWLLSGGSLDQIEQQERTYPWHRVMWLTGVDYFSSLAYQAGIALIAAGYLAPTATLVLVIVTLIGALPVYAQVAGRSYAGQGSIAMLEHLFSGWKSKILVLVLLGFAGTDFVITMTLSAADAARHAVANPYLSPYIGRDNLKLTVLLLLILAVIFLIGFREAIVVATILAVPFIVLNVVILATGLFKICQHLELITHWRAGLTAHTNLSGVMVASVIVFPKLALGLSGFETGVAVMPLVADENRERAGPEGIPLGRVRNSRKLLASAAVLMGVLLLASSFVTTLLIPESAYREGGLASGRALAYLAHQMLGDIFGTLYDVSTISILWFAGASAMAGLISLIPRYLPRFGMAPRWVSYRRPMVLVLFVIDMAITFIFDAGVEAQGSAYATGVLVVILSAAMAVTVTLWHEFRADWRHHLASLPLSIYFCGVSLLFVYTVIANVIERPDGAIISTVFILAILTLSAISRYQRSQELRVSTLTFIDEKSEVLWSELIGKKVNLVPYGSSPEAQANKAAEIRQNYQVSGPLAFLHVNLIDDRSEFVTPLRVAVLKQGEVFTIQIWGAVAIANTIAFITELIDPISVFLFLTGANLMLQSVRYLLWGEGETGLMVYTILVRRWERTHDQSPKPKLYLMSA